MLSTEMVCSERSTALRWVRFSPASKVMIDANYVMELEGRLRGSRAGEGIADDDYRERAWLSESQRLKPLSEMPRLEGREAEAAQKQSDQAADSDAMGAELRTSRAEITKIRDASLPKWKVVSSRLIAT